MPLVPFLPNLLLSILAGLLISAWLLYYTDVFPAVGGLLGLGGLFTWIAFLLGLVSKSTKDQLQGRFEAAVLRRSGIAWAVVTGLLLFALWTAGRGTVLLIATGADLPRTVRVSVEGPAGETEVLHEGFLPASQVAKLVLPGWLRWRRGGAYLVKVGGLPAASVEVRPWRRTRVPVPEFFQRRPVVLVRPVLTLTRTAETSPEGQYRLEVRRNGAVAGTLEDYRGEAVWIGCDEDVAVPDSRRERWRLELIAAGLPPDWASRWEAPRAVASRTLLARGDQLEVVLAQGVMVVARARGSVRELARAHDFPQEVQLDWERAQ